jgi:hypothetical protein
MKKAIPGGGFGTSSGELYVAHRYFALSATRSLLCVVVAGFVVGVTLRSVFEEPFFEWSHRLVVAFLACYIPLTLVVVAS